MKKVNKSILLALLIVICSTFALTSCSLDSIMDKVNSIIKKDEVECAHESTDWVIDKNATCSEEGSKRKICLACEETLETKTIDKTAHTEELIAGKDATCTAGGLTAGKKCSVCNTVILKQEATSAKPHTEKLVAGKNATCTEDGLTDGKICSVCNTVIVKQETIAKRGHTEETILGRAATCTEAGITNGKKCSVCDLVILEQQTIPVTDHTESEWIIDRNAEIGVDGSKHKECLVCHELLETETIPAIVETHVHEGVEWVTVTPATCTSTGVKHLICECGKQMDTATVSMAPHTEETVAGKAATCEKEGLTDGKKCSVCGEVLLAKTAIEKLPHLEQIIPGVTATCQNTGLTEGKKCSVCGEILVAQSATAKTGHKEEIILGKKATCTEEGLTDGKKCIVCNLTTAQQIVTPATGHSFTDGTCVNCGTSQPYGIWIVDGQGNPISDIFVKIMQNGEQIKTYPYNGEFLSMPLERGNYQIELDLSLLDTEYVYNESDCTLSPEAKTATIRLFKTADERDSLYVSYPLDADYPAYGVDVGATKVDLAPNDYTFFIFSPTVAAVYAITYECDSNLQISYHGGSFFTQGIDLTGSSSEISRYENGISITVYASNVGGEYVIGVKSNGATSCILNIKNAGDPGTRLEDEPWTPYLEDESKVAADLAVTKDGTYTAIDLTDLTLKAVYNENDGYYHLNSADGPIIFIDLTSDSKFIVSVQTICGNQRMGAYIYDLNGNVVEKRSYNELFHQYGMPESADITVSDPVRVPLTAKLAEAIKSFGDKNFWWAVGSEANIFNPVLLGAPYNQEYAWLLYCGYYAN